jgi:acyl-CoA thioesterase-1
MTVLRFLPVLVISALVQGCTQSGSSNQAARPAGDAVAYDEPDRAPASSRVVIAFLGDSLTAGLGLLSSRAYPSLIGDMFLAEGYAEVEILNGGISGDTTAGAARRVDQLLAPDVRILVVALGGNDALRGLTAEQTRSNLTTIIETAFDSGAEVLLAGMQAPTNLGQDYQAAFREVFFGLARDYGRRISFVSFLLEGVAAQPHLNQADGIHPNEQGARVIAEHLYPPLRDMVDALPSAAFVP